MSFFETQKGIISRCIYGTTVIIAPGAAIITYNQQTTLTVSGGYFLSCIAKEEITAYLKSEENSQETNFAIDVVVGAVGGVAYTASSSFPLVPAIFMSTGYTMLYNYIDRPFLSLSIIAVEIITDQLDNTPNLKAGLYSGVVFAALDIMEYTATKQNIVAEKMLDNQMIPIQSIFNVSKDQCLVGEEPNNHAEF